MRLLGSTLILLLAAACTAVPSPGQGPATGSPAATASPAGTASPTHAPDATAAPAQPTRPPTGTPPLGTVPVPPTPPGVVGEVPQDLIDLVTAEAAALAGVTVADVRVVRAEQVTWNDGSLGCPQPDVVYTQALVDGYWVVLEAGGESYDFRLGSAGGPLLCPAGQGRPPVDPGLDD